MATTDPAPGRSGPGSAGSLTLGLTRILLGAVVLDLVVTRLIVRLAIFIPKGEPWASLGGVLGRLGAATDAFVPIAGLLLLGALLAEAGRRRRWADGAILAGISVVAGGGLAFIVLERRPWIVGLLDGIVIVIAGAAALRMARLRGPGAARAGVVLLAGGIGLAAAARLLDLLGGASGPDASSASTGAASLLPIAAGQVAFLGGAGLLGLAGLVMARGRGGVGRRAVVAGVGVGAIVLGAGTFAPAMSAIVMIWSIGLTGALPSLIVAVALGLAVAGLPGLHRSHPALALGAAVTLGAGFDLAASGLVLAGLLGLFVAGSEEQAG